MYSKKRAILFIVIGMILGFIFSPVIVGAAQKVHDYTAEVYYNSGDDTIHRFDDPDFQVKCWTSDGYQSGGISCIPWSELKER